MPCTTRIDMTELQRQAQRKALERLRAGLAAGTITVVVGRSGSVAFKGWTDNGGVSDLCAYRALASSPELRRAVMRAEALTGVKVSPQAIASGLHSHDGGATWGTH